jgi:hypothetical protein
MITFKTRRFVNASCSFGRATRSSSLHCQPPIEDCPHCLKLDSPASAFVMRLSSLKLILRIPMLINPWAMPSSSTILTLSIHRSSIFLFRHKHALVRPKPPLQKILSYTIQWSIVPFKNDYSVLPPSRLFSHHLQSCFIMMGEPIVLSSTTLPMYGVSIHHLLPSVNSMGQRFKPLVLASLSFFRQLSLF